jgi:hypothetical protein
MAPLPMEMRRLPASAPLFRSISAARAHQTHRDLPTRRAASANNTPPPPPPHNRLCVMGKQDEHETKKNPPWGVKCLTT